MPRPIASAELEAAVAGAPPREQAMLLLAAFEGMRCVEIARLTREDVFEHKDPPIIIAYGKGSKERIIPLHPEVLQALRRLPLPRTGPVFRYDSGAPFTAQRVSQIANTYLHDAGTDSTMHQLRHFFGTHTYRTSLVPLTVG
jgi:integrase/recombinase XerC